MDLNYPKHEHPHGIDSMPDERRIWVCAECGHIFSDKEFRKKTGWGHPCKLLKRGIYCESHLEPYVPEIARKG